MYGASWDQNFSNGGERWDRGGCCRNLGRMGVGGEGGGVGLLAWTFIFALLAGRSAEAARALGER